MVLFCFSNRTKDHLLMLMLNTILLLIESHVKFQDLYKQGLKFQINAHFHTWKA